MIDPRIAAAPDKVPVRATERKNRPAWIFGLSCLCGRDCQGGLLFISFGLYPRWVVAVLILILIGALLVHSQNGWVFSAAGGGWEYPAFLVLACGVLILLATVWHQTCRRSDNSRG